MATSRTCAPPACGEFTNSAEAIIVSRKKNGSGRLSMDGKIRSAIPVQLTENLVELRDGSDAHPLTLPNLKGITSESVPRILIMLPDGQIAYWDMAAFAGHKRLVIENGSAKFVDDYSSDLFSGEICEGTCDDIDAGLGVRLITHNCPGKPPKTMYQLVRTPKCCCTLDELQCSGEACTSLGFTIPV
jgi:hypothetical protein